MMQSVACDFTGTEGLGGVEEMSDGPLRLHTLEDVIAWAQAHHAEVRAYWSEQRRTNASSSERTLTCQTYMTTELKEIRRDIQQMRSRIFYAMGCASVLGAGLTMAAAAFLQRV